MRRLPMELGYSFENADLLRTALTHRSHGAAHNERLEFLGDSVLNFVIAAQLYDCFPELPEGDLSRLRAHLVRQDSLYRLAQGLNLGNDLHLGEGELKSGGHRRLRHLRTGHGSALPVLQVHQAGYRHARHATE